jgi:hypothetical protein
MKTRMESDAWKALFLNPAQIEILVKTGWLGLQS